jgi:hypothetical protein
MMARAEAIDEFHGPIEAQAGRAGGQASPDQRRLCRERHRDAVDRPLAILPPAGIPASAQVDRIEHAFAVRRGAVGTLATARRRAGGAIVDLHRRIAGRRAAVGVTR